jgi:hypothetical protein
LESDVELQLVDVDKRLLHAVLIIRQLTGSCQVLKAISVFLLLVARTPPSFIAYTPILSEIDHVVSLFAVLDLAVSPHWVRSVTLIPVLVFA